MQSARNIILSCFNASASFFHDLKKLFFNISGLTVEHVTFILPGIWICESKSVSCELPCSAATHLFLYLAPGFWCQPCDISSKTPEGEVAERFSSNADHEDFVVMSSCYKRPQKPSRTHKECQSTLTSCRKYNGWPVWVGRPGPKLTILQGLVWLQRALPMWLHSWWFSICTWPTILGAWMLVVFDAAEFGLLRGPETQRKGRCSYQNTSISSSLAECLNKNALGELLLHCYGWLTFFKHWQCSRLCVNCLTHTWTEVTWPTQGAQSIVGEVIAPGIPCPKPGLSVWGQIGEIF